MITEILKERFHVGQRMVKTVLAVFMCFVIDYFRSGGNPFHSAIAAIVCMQRSVQDSWETGRQRIIATIIGGIYGTIVIAFEVYVYSVPHELLRYFVLSLLLIPVIKLTVALKQEKGVAMASIVYLAITISSPTTTGINAALNYSTNRIMDTLIGVVIALGVNAIPMDYFKRFVKKA